MYINYARDNMRKFFADKLAACVFLGTYFVTVVLGNFLFNIPISRDYIEASGCGEIYTFKTIFTLGYWLLLLCPFIVVPIIVYIVRRSPLVKIVNLVSDVRDLSRGEYFVVAFLIYIYLWHSFHVADAVNLFMQGSDAVSSVEARFIIRERLGFLTLLGLMSLMPFLSIYSMVQWFRGGGVYWLLWNLIHFILLTVMFILLNMKWPILIYYASIVLSIFVYSVSRPYISSVFGIMVILITYFMISSFVYRLAELPVSRPAESPVSRPAEGPVSRPAEGPVSRPAEGPVSRPAEGPVSRPAESPVERSSESYEKIVLIAEAASKKIPFLLISAINRMAVIYPYYYQIGTDEGPVCGGVQKYFRFGAPCRPSTYIYTRIFGKDGFEGRGTSPAAVHITAYTLGGWPLAIFFLIVMSFVIGLITILPLDKGVLSGSLAVFGGLMGYHFSQLPIEGPFVYDHGLIWILAMVALLLLVRRLYSNKYFER